MQVFGLAAAQDVDVGRGVEVGGKSGAGLRSVPGAAFIGPYGADPQAEGILDRLAEPEGLEDVFRLFRVHAAKRS